MDGELDVVVVEPAAWNDGDAVETRDAGLREERGQDVADDTPNSVRSEDLKTGHCQALAHEMNKRARARAAHIEGIVVASEELQLRGEVAQRACHEAK